MSSFLITDHTYVFYIHVDFHMHIDMQLTVDLLSHAGK